MAILTIEGVAPYDGDYQFDASYFTNRELHIVKKVTSLDGTQSVRAGELQEALEAGDTDVMVALAIIAAKRNGVDIPADSIWDSPAGKVSLALDDTEAVDDFPPESAPPNANYSGGELADESKASGPGSASTTESQGSAPSPTGLPV